MKVATIEKIIDVREHPNADSLSLCTIKGWQVCTKKNEFKISDLVIYITVDSIVDDLPPYEFLRSKSFKIKPIKLRGQLSYGIVFPLSLLLNSFNYTGDIAEGLDVSEIIGAKHYEKDLPANMRGEIKGHRPSFIRKTDEELFKNYPELIDEFKGLSYYISIKNDGMSSSFYFNNGVFGVCSRNLELKQDYNTVFWKIAQKYDIENKLKSLNKNVCIQGECVGPGIQGNLLGLKEIDITLFNLFDIDNQRYLGYYELVDICNKLNIPMVNVIEVCDNFNYTLHDLQNIANELKYDNNNFAEGIVIRGLNEKHSQILNGRLSGKVISEPFELKHS